MPGGKATPSKKRKSVGLSDSSSDGDVHESPFKAKAKPAPSSRTSEGSAASTIKFCYVCSEPAYGRVDVCQEHKRVTDVMKYQAEKQGQSGFVFDELVTDNAKLTEALEEFVANT